MAGNNSIQILRGNNVKSTAASEVLLDGQPLYDRATGYLYVGENRTVASTQAVNAHYANTAGTASSATQANYVKGYLYFNGVYSNGTTYNTSWDGRDTEVLYVPTGLGSTGQVWGMVNSNRAGWINQTEIPGTIENANHANTADVAYEVSGSNVTGTVANANFANTAGKLEGTLKLRIANINVGYNGVDGDFTSKNIVATTTATQIGGIPYSIEQGTKANISWLAKGNTGQVLTATASGIAWANPNTLNVNSANIANRVESNLNIRVMGANYTYNGSSLVNIRSRNIVATNTSVDRGAIPYANTNGTTTTAANVKWLAKGDDGQVLTATSTGIAWQTLSTLSLPSYTTTIDNSYVGLPILASTYMITKVIGAHGSVDVANRGGTASSITFGDNNLIIIGIRPGSNQITISYSNGNSSYYTAPSSIVGIALTAPSGARYVVTKLSDD